MVKVMKEWWATRDASQKKVIISVAIFLLIGSYNVFNESSKKKVDNNVSARGIVTSPPAVNAPTSTPVNNVVNNTMSNSDVAKKSAENILYLQKILELHKTYIQVMQEGFPDSEQNMSPSEILTRLQTLVYKLNAMWLIYEKTPFPNNYVESHKMMGHLLTNSLGGVLELLSAGNDTTKMQHGSDRVMNAMKSLQDYNNQLEKDSVRAKKELGIIN